MTKTEQDWFDRAMRAKQKGLPGAKHRKLRIRAALSKRPLRTPAICMLQSAPMALMAAMAHNMSLRLILKVRALLKSASTMAGHLMLVKFICASRVTQKPEQCSTK